MGLEAGDAEVGVEAGGDALEEFLVGFEGDGEEFFVVGGEAADQAVVGDGGAQGAGVDVVAVDVGRAPDLAGGVAGFGGPVAGGHAREFAVEEDEAFSR